MIYPVTWQFDGENAWLEFYALLNHGQLHVIVEITEDPALLRTAHVYNKRNRIENYRWRIYNAPAGYRDTFASGTRERFGRAVFWFPTGPGAPSLLDYLTKEQEQ